MPQLKLIEKHISERALPGEGILSWIKWQDDFDFDRLDIKAADINFDRIFNVDASVFDQKTLKKGCATIGRDVLQIPDFVGFRCTYALVPETERELNFVIEFSKGGTRYWRPLSCMPN